MHSKNLLQNRRPDVYKLVNDLGCRFKYVDEIYLDDLIIDQGIYPRESTDWERVKMYAENLENGAEFPPILIVERESDFKKIILDGNHRYYAHKEIDKDKIVAEVWEVPESLYPVVAQAVNTEEKEIDTPLTPVEKKKAILRDWEILTHYDKETRKEIIAKILKTSVAYVNKVLSEAGLIRSEKEELKKKVSQLNEKGLSPKEISKETGVDLKTVYRWLNNFSKFTQVKNEKNEEEPQTEPDWSDWNETEEIEEQDELDQETTGWNEEDNDYEKPEERKSKKTQKENQFKHPNEVLEKLKESLWAVLVEIEFRFNYDTAIDVLSEIYTQWHNKSYKQNESYKDWRAELEYKRLKGKA